MTPLLFHWPHWTYAISWLWVNPVSYNFWSSGWGETLLEIVKLGILFLLLRPLYKRVAHHLECRAPGCERWGHPIHGTSFRACVEHHPHLSEEGHTPEEMAHAAVHGHPDSTAD